MKVEKKQSQPSILDKAKEAAISRAVDQYAKNYENKTGKTVNANALKAIFLQHADVVENVMTKGGLEEKVKTAVDTVESCTLRRLSTSTSVLNYWKTYI